MRQHASGRSRCNGGNKQRQECRSAGRRNIFNQKSGNGRYPREVEGQKDNPSMNVGGFYL